MKKTIFLLIIWLFASSFLKKENNPQVNPDCTGTLTYAGKTYKTIIINGKEWMAENLAYLPAVFLSSDGSMVDPRYYVYGYQGSDVVAAKNKSIYARFGVLYNWPAALASCPPGWHLPSDAEWTALTTFLGGEDVAGGKLKEAGTTHWIGPNTGATNEIGFTALAGGYRYSNGSYDNIGKNGIWWGSAEFGTGNAWIRFLNYDDIGMSRDSYREECGFSVRYVKD